jgi:biopolymer transport protein ExbD
VTRILVVLSLLLLPACADSASDGHPRIALPPVGAVGATPAELGLDQVVVTVTADGRIFTADGETDPAALVAWLTPHADRSRDDSMPQRVSNVHLLIRADSGAPWSAVDGVLRAAADPQNGMNRVLFAVRLEQRREVVEGAFAYFLPLDSGLGSEPVADESIVLVRVTPQETVALVLMTVDWLHRGGHRPVVAVADKFDLRMESADGGFRVVDPMTIEGPWVPPRRWPDLAGITVLREMLLEVIPD